MKYDPHRHHRRSIRLKDYDYSQTGWYYVTLVVQNRECLLGKVVNDSMELSAPGKIAKNNWLKIPYLRPNIGLDEFIIMPNHFHRINQYCRDRPLCLS